MKYRLLLLLLVLIVVVPFPAASQGLGTADEWTMFQHDLAHTGYTASTAPTTNQTRWVYPTGSGVI
jgi:PKD repeat protein